MAYEWDKLPGNVGVRPRTREVYLTAHGTVTEGVMYTLDTTTAGTSTYGVATSSAAAADGATDGKVWVIALESGTTGDRLKFALRGWVKATCSAVAITVTTDAIAVSSDTSGDIVAAPVGDFIVGIAPESISANETGYIWFDGAGVNTKPS